MVILLPRLPAAAAEILLNQHMSDGFAAWSGFKPDDLPTSVRFAATGGARVVPHELAALRERILKIARSNGLGTPDVRATYASFDAELAAVLTDDPLFASGEALRDDVWTFVGTALAPDIVHWRFGPARERYLGGVRNTFQRLWMRGRAIDRGANHSERWKLLEELTEDALVQITERPSLGGDPVLATAIAEAWVRASLHHGRGAMEPIMRKAALRVRIWNEIRSLADLPSEQLAGVLDSAFEIDSDHGDSAVLQVELGASEAGRTDGLNESRDGDDSQETRNSENLIDASRQSMSQAAMRVLEEARERGWISPKSLKALNALQQGDRDLRSSERNAIDYLFNRMRAAAVLREEVSHLSQAIALPMSPSRE